jgi:hypothetical protein
VVHRKDFKSEKETELEWAKVSTFNLTLVDHQKKKAVRLTDPASRSILMKIELIDGS